MTQQELDALKPLVEKYRQQGTLVQQQTGDAIARLVAEVERLQAYVVRLEQTIDRKDAALERGHQVQNELHRKLAQQEAQA